MSEKVEVPPPSRTVKLLIATVIGIVIVGSVVAILALRSAGLATSPGFFGTRGSLMNDLTLVAALLLLAGLIVGWRMAKQKNIPAHQYIQTSMVLLYLVLIEFIMAVSFSQQVQPGIPARLAKAYYASSTLHAALGGLAQVAGIYLILRMNRLLPKALRVKWWKNLMRGTLSLYVVVAAFGVATYYVWYMLPATGTGAVEVQPVEVAEAKSVTLPMLDFMYVPVDITVPVGTTVIWVNQDAAPHTITLDDGSIDSGALEQGQTFEVTFNQVGAFDYYCAFHGSPGGHDMAGKVIVVPADQVAGVPTQAAPLAPTPAPTPENAPVQYFGPQAIGVGVFRDAQGRSDEFRIIAANLTAPADGSHLEVWLLGDAAPLDVGSLAPDAAGNALLSYVAPDGGNLLGRFSAFTVTIEPADDTDPAPSGEVVFAGQIPAAALDDIRRMLVSDSDARKAESDLVGLLTLSDELARHAKAANGSALIGDLDSVRRHAEHMVTVLTGLPEDLNGDGDSFSYDGFGVLKFAELTAAHAEAALEAAPDSDNVVGHAGHVLAGTKDVLDWGAEAEQLARQMAVVQDNATAQSLAKQALELSDHILNGFDADGDGAVAPRITEAGAFTAYFHAQFMAAMGVVTEER